MPNVTTRAIRFLCGLSLLLYAAGAAAQSRPAEGVVLPAGATGLQGLPTVRVDTTADATKRSALTPAEASKQGLRIKVDGSRYYWASRDNEELTLRSSGEFVYLTTTNPGQYVRLRRINDRFAYVEHLDMGFESVTYFGELRIVLGK